MRVSVFKTDKGYTPFSMYYEVFLNGEKLSNCYTADEELGKAWIYDFEAIPPEGKVFATRELTGKIDIRKMDEYPG